MNNSRQHKTKEEFARELGMSPSTFYRRIRKLQLQEYLGGELLSPAEQDELTSALDNYKKEKTASMRKKIPPVFVDTN
jgi:DNA-binding MurR/RpiR family transcriptional regulator